MAQSDDQPNNQGKKQVPVEVCKTKLKKVIKQYKWRRYSKNRGDINPLPTMLVQFFGKLLNIITGQIVYLVLFHHSLSWRFYGTNKLPPEIIFKHFQATLICSKIIMETRGQCMKSVQSYRWRHQQDVVDVFLVSLLLFWNRFQTLFWCIHCWIWTSKCRLGYWPSPKTISV